jgi:3-oxoacyl-[acyl-carrier protein] reductase
VAGLARQPRLASRNVTLNNLLPGPFDTERLRSTIAAMAQRQGQPFEAAWEARRKANPTQRYGSPGEFGAACAFLCSVHASYINGQNVLLDGGGYPGTF